MAPSTNKGKVPRGRKPAGAVLVDGKWQLTQESVTEAADRILKYREHNRKRYREMRELLRAEHPELFAQPDPQQSLLVPRSEEKGLDLKFYQKTGREEGEAKRTREAEGANAPHTGDRGLAVV